MADLLSFDTTFLIDLQKERLANRKGGANQFLQRHQGSLMALSCVALGEFAEGFKDRNDPTFERIVAAVQILEVDLETSWLYGQSARRLRRAGKLVGSNDLWIGCCAVRDNTPLVTRNGAYFRRIEGLEVIEY